MIQFRYTIICLVSCMFPAIVMAQAIDNNLSFKNIDAEKYVRLNYENDFFTATDEYYTQGINLELVAPWISRFPLSKLLARPRSGTTRYGIGFEHAGYTPTSISSDAVLYRDRPFTATLHMKTFLTAVDTAKKRRFSSVISLGVIGQAAGGMEMQTGIHRWLHNITPHGWPNQIHNDAIINYQVDIEKQLLSYGHSFSLDADAMGRAGTLSDKVSVGATLMAGYFDSPFKTGIGQKNNLRIYAYDHPEVDAVGYDATLEGGVFNKTSPYTIAEKDITRVVVQNRFGVVILYQGFHLEYFQSIITKEFISEKTHRWGGVQVAYAF